MSPRRSLSTEPPPGSKSAPRDRSTPPNPPSEDPGFTESKQFCAQDPGSENPSDGIDPEATEPFPPDLFRVPVPNKVFSEMPSVSDSALRCLLGLIYLSFRFDPAESEWVHVGEWVTRSDVETECGLSCQGTRNGLGDLQSLGWVEVDRSGRSYRYRLTLSVPDRQFTYVPTALLEGASELGSATELRVVLAVLRETWGWTGRETDPESGQKQTVHDRWTRLSTGDLAEATGRSTSAVKGAAQALQGRWIGRTRPGNGAYQYRFLPEAVREDPGEIGEDSDEMGPEAKNPTCRPTANDLAPERQNSGPPSFNKENLPKDRHGRPSTSGRKPQRSSSPPAKRDAVPKEDPRSRGRPPPQEKNPSEAPERRESSLDFGSLPPEKQDLARKLSNVGVWDDRIAGLLTRFSMERVRANFELYRQRAAEQVIRKPGAWLHEAITDGYAVSNSNPTQSEGASATNSGPAALPDHKETLSEAKKHAYVAQGVDEDRFHRCLSTGEATTEKTFMYFDPDEGGSPEQRVPKPQT